MFMSLMADDCLIPNLLLQMSTSKPWLTGSYYTVSAPKKKKKNHCFQQFLHCCMCISFRGNVFTQSLSHNGKCNHVTICSWHIKNHSCSSLSTSNCIWKLGRTFELNWHLQCKGYISHTTRNRVKPHCSLWSSPRTQTIPRILVRKPLGRDLSFKYLSLEIQSFLHMISSWDVRFQMHYNCKPSLHVSQVHINKSYTMNEPQFLQEYWSLQKKFTSKSQIPLKDLTLKFHLVKKITTCQNIQPFTSPISAHNFNNLCLPRNPASTMSFRRFILPPANLGPNTLLKSWAIWAATSMPTSSARVAAPTGKPNDFVSLSSSLGSTPS
jgi:hypothetical protein